ncbi:DedA family protein [Helicobacter cappadocius]|uniref:DedA family protein n=1 Tax=Helicobacter cappadocius TaxID=3063998 RepID=A0AA90PJB5_9HELI|nr:MULTISPECIES: DedA family protein [unclassified Helicobacter]MDO7252387.1 DedA family protein [Helicobacter sp. faydin-H75]MDP2538254.1 DedA family protein [Helicobacter sp. faydin-H76]
MQQTIQSFQDSYQTWGYLLLFVYCMGSGYVGIVVAGILSSLGSMDIGISIIVAFLGNTFGSSILAFLGRYQKNEILKYFAKHRRKVALVHIWMKKYGVWLILFNKYIYGIKTIVPIAIGVSKYKMGQFLILNAIACLIWAFLIGMVSFFASEFVKKIFSYIADKPYLMPIIFLILLGIVWILLKKISKRGFN